MTFSIGIDYGTSSGRVFLVDTSNGNIISSYIKEYEHGTISETLNGQELPHHYFLQNADDYVDILEKGVKYVLEDSQVAANDVIGIGIDFTSCTIVFLDKEFNPLHNHSDLIDNPHAYVKLWKHHGAQEEATYMKKISEKYNQSWIQYYGHNVSSEWMIPKILEVKRLAPEILTRSAYIMEAGDYLVSLLTGKNTRSNCGIGFKGFYNEQDGFNYDFFKAVDSELPDIIKSKCEAPVVKIGESAGKLTKQFQQLWGLSNKVEVSPFIIDAHSGVLGVGAIKQGEFTSVIGTSTCHLLLDSKQEPIPAITGSVKDAIIPNMYAYEAGQPAVGDLFNYSAKMAPKAIVDKANEKNISVLEYLEVLASNIDIEKQHVTVMDWHNGNRSILSDSLLTGSIMGLTLTTPYEMIHRAYIEATAFGTKMILQQFENNNIDIHTVYAAGGIPMKSKLLIDIYANVLNKPIVVIDASNATALGAAMLGAYVGGAYKSVKETVMTMKQPVYYRKQPDPNKVKQYERLFERYQAIHDLLGKSYPSYTYI
ncbi:ribulokinase [Staphylococcus sp. ACRSN]|uniref:ribulokinase n=1 Tax=Staphylococcus sp. ACRSN TaxID=2918214 RepID=UPI001EF19C93|nr:ribulokinase [Staphylococcus sp. ACRSN]MCG7338194.1 ribulokinase [Staphylococcus sp. ACRSN]